ncbi:MAG: leucine-rich repeat domain-containing protein, partial [Clostridia bacterium]|nr:leucine-rich repeat domain-containing protein [Clostridia bacterium]
MLAVFCLLLAAVPGLQNAYADSVMLTSMSSSYSGLMMSFDTNRMLLTIEGSGKIPALTSESAAPWAEYRSAVRSLYIGEGITDIGSRAFSGLTNLESVTLPSTLRSIESDAFSGCNSVTSVNYAGSATYLYDIISKRNVSELLAPVRRMTGATTTSLGANARTLTAGTNTNTGRYNDDGWYGGDDGSWGDWNPPKKPDNKTPAPQNETTPKPDKPETTKKPPVVDDPETEDYVIKDEKGRVTDSRETQEDGTVKKTTITYDEKGNKADETVQILDKDGNVQTETSTSVSVKDDGSRTVTETNTTYDEDGKVSGTETKSETLDKDGKKIADSWSDSDGNSREATYNADGVETSSKETRISKGNKEVETRELQEDGKTTLGSIVRESKDGTVQIETYKEEQYADDRYLISGDVTDEEGNDLGHYASSLRETEDGYTYVYNKYGEIGNQTDEMLYDKEGNFISGKRVWDDNSGKGGQSVLDEQGREVSGYIQNAGEYDEFTYTYNEDGTV